MNPRCLLFSWTHFWMRCAKLLIRRAYSLLVFALLLEDQIIRNLHQQIDSNRIRISNWTPFCCLQGYLTRHINPLCIQSTCQIQIGFLGLTNVMSQLSVCCVFILMVFFSGVICSLLPKYWFLNCTDLYNGPSHKVITAMHMCWFLTFPYFQKVFPFYNSDFILQELMTSLFRPYLISYVWFYCLCSFI